MEPLFTPLDYDKLSDDLFYLGSGIVLRLNVVLAKKKEDGSRNYFHKEYLYGSKYIDKNKVITMRRNFDYYLTIDKYCMYEQTVIIRIQNMILMKMKLKEVSKWFSDGETFILKKGKLVIQKKPKPIIVSGLSMHKSLRFEPIVIDWENSGQQQPGVRMVLNESDIYTDISIDNFYGFLYLIDTLNLYESAQLMINYLGRPSFGSNLTEFDNGNDFSLLEEQIEPNSVIAKDGRKPKNLRNQSFFDKIDEL